MKVINLHQHSSQITYTKLKSISINSFDALEDVDIYLFGGVICRSVYITVIKITILNNMN